MSLVMIPVSLFDAAFRRRLRRSAVSAGYRLCPQCGYDASRGEPSGTTVKCPECGESFDAHAVAALWRVYLA
jgi:uncharacterized protein (UPF0212 family)